MNEQATKARHVARRKLAAATLIFGAATIGVFWWLIGVTMAFLRALDARPSSIEFDNAIVLLPGIGICLFAALIAFARDFAMANAPSSRLFGRAIAVGVLLGVVVFVAMPPVATRMVDDHLTTAGYAVCEEASHRWLHARTIVYVRSLPGLCEQLATKRPAYSM